MVPQIPGTGDRSQGVEGVPFRGLATDYSRGLLAINFVSCRTI